MFLFYLDEAGCTGALDSPQSVIQPIFVLAGAIMGQRNVQNLTWEWLQLKQRFFPNRLPGGSKFLDWMRIEIKGADVRRDVREGNRDERRAALGFLDKSLGILEKHDVRLLGRLYVKPIAGAFDGTAVYTSAVQNLAAEFEQLLRERRDKGLLILDSRNKSKDSCVSHSILTQKFRTGGDRFPNLLEMPLFGRSDNHAVLQLTDMLCSAILFPMATYVYCLGHLQSVHVNMRYDVIRDTFGKRIKAMQYRFQDEKGFWRGGITVSDGIGKQSGATLFHA